MPLNQLVGAGLYEPTAANAGERRELLEHLLSRGLAVEEIIAAANATLPRQIASRLSRSWQPTLSIRGAAAKAGVDVARVLRLGLACGFPADDVDAVELPEFVVQDIELFDYACNEFGDEPIEAFAQVLASSADRVVESSRAIFSDAVRQGSATELQISHASEATAEMWPAITTTLTNLIRQKASGGYDLMRSLLPTLCARGLVT